MKRPVVVVAIALVGGAYLAAGGVLAGPWLAVPWAVAAFALVYSRRGWLRGRTLSIVACFLGVGALWWHAREVGPNADSLSRYLAVHPGVAGTFEGRVRWIDLTLPESTYTRLVIDVDRVEADGRQIPVRGGMLIRWRDPGIQLYGRERVRVLGQPSLSLDRVNFGIHGYEDYLRARGVNSMLRTRGTNAVERVARAPWYSVRHWTARFRAAQAVRFSQVIPESARAFVGAVWLGDRSRMTQPEVDTYVTSGTAHVLAVSGVHAGIVFVSASFLFRLLIRGQRLRAALTLAAILVFALTTGARVPIVRASVMIGLYLTADLFRRERDALTSLSVAAILFLLWSPRLLFDGGFQLSFLSVASILVFCDAIGKRMTRLPFALRTGLSTSLSVQLLPLPLAIRSFHVLPLGAPLANLLVVPLLTGALWLSFLTTTTAFLFPKAAILFGHALVPVVYLIRAVAGLTTAAPGLHARLTSPSIFAVCCYWTALGLFFVKGRHLWRWRAGAVGLLFLTVVAWSPPRLSPTVDFLDVGAGDATFVRSAGGGTALIDGGACSEYGDMGAKVVAPFLWAHHVSRLDYVVLTHPDNDHIGGLTYVIDHFPVGTLVLGPVDTNSDAEQALVALCEQRGVPVRRVGPGERLALDRAYFEVLHPPRDWPLLGSTNDASLVLRLHWEGVRVLLTGDIEQRGENAVRKRDCAAEILKVPHHGSKTSSTDAFLAAVNPAHCVLSTGQMWGRDLASTDVLERFAERGAIVWRTDRMGGIRLRSARGEVVVESARQACGYIQASTPVTGQP